MQVKDGYKQTEVGVIPKDWIVKKIGAFSTPVRGGSPRPAGDLRYFNGNFIPWLTVASLTNIPTEQTIVTQTAAYLTEEGSLRSRKLSKGTLIIANSGATLGVAKILGITCCANDGIAALLGISKGIDTRFIVYYINTLTADLRDRVATGNGQPNLNTDLISRLTIPLPPTIAEQEAIAGALSDADAWIESLEQLIAKKRRIKEGTSQALLTGKQRLPGFSGEWEVKTLPEVSQFRGGKAHEQFISEHGRYICVNSKFISSEGKVRKYSTANFCCAKAKDILMVMSDLPNGKALAKVFLADKDDLYAVNQRVCALSTYDNYSADFLSYILNRNPYFLKFDDGVSQTHLLNRVFEKCPLNLPPTKAEQTAIAAILSEMDSELDALESKLSKARQIKQGIMQELLTGKTRLVTPASNG